jgi:hypothetical protein
MFYKINNILSNPNFRLLFLTIFFFILFNISLLFRGTGWDGDSIVNIHQFYKIINPNLYNGPDGGTTPKFFPILLFGGFHFIFNSYSIHLVVFIICSYAFAKSTLLTKRFGGGNIWFVLPFTSPMFLNDIMSANNPALSSGFYMLSLVFLFEKKIILCFIFLLFSEFSRPGYSILMLISLFFLTYINYSDLKKQKKKIFFIISLVIVGFIHSFYCYKLSYASFTEYMDQNWGMYYPGYKLTPEDFINNKFETILIFFKGAVTAIFSNHLFPFPITILVIFLMILLFKRLKDISTIIFILPIIFFPMLYAGLTKGTMVSSPTTPKLLPNFDNALDPSYFITIVPILMFAVSINFNKFILKWEILLKNYHNAKILNYSSKILICLKNPIIFMILGLFLSVINGILLKNRFDYNPPKPLVDAKHFWYSSNLSQKIFKEVYSKKNDKLKILIACDPIPILIDNALLIKEANFVSIDLKFNRKKKEYIKLCDQGNTFKKRPKDIILSKTNQQNIFENYDYDVIYITKDIQNYFKLSVDAKIIQLKHERLIIINGKYK